MQVCTGQDMFLWKRSWLYFCMPLWQGCQSDTLANGSSILMKQFPSEHISKVSYTSLLIHFFARYFWEVLFVLSSPPFYTKFVYLPSDTTCLWGDPEQSQVFSILWRCPQRHWWNTYQLLPICCRTAFCMELKRWYHSKLLGMLYLQFVLSVCTEWMGWLGSWCSSIWWCPSNWSDGAGWKILSCRCRISSMSATHLSISLHKVPSCWMGLCRCEVCPCSYSFNKTCLSNNHRPANKEELFNFHYRMLSSIFSGFWSVVSVCCSWCQKTAWKFKHKFQQHWQQSIISSASMILIKHYQWYGAVHLNTA